MHVLHSYSYSTSPSTSYLVLTPNNKHAVWWIQDFEKGWEENTFSGCWKSFSVNNNYYYVCVCVCGGGEAIAPVAGINMKHDMIPQQLVQLTFSTLSFINSYGTSCACIIFSAHVHGELKVIINSINKEDDRVIASYIAQQIVYV